MKSNERWIAFAICLGLSGLVWFVFGQTLGFDFVNYDDYDYVLKNPHIANGLTWDGMGWAFTHLYALNWHPLTWISHMLDCQLYGLAPRGHHLSNIILHTASAILLFLVLRAMTGALWRSAFVAALFAIHPLRVESVAWISERKDVLSGLFFVLTLGAYLRYSRQPSHGRYLLLLVTFFFSLMCKPMLVTVPLILLLLDYWPLGRIKRRKPGSSEVNFPLRLVVEKLILLLPAGALSLITFIAQRRTIASLDRLSIPLRLSNALASCLTYLRQMFYPRPLAVFYPMTDRAISPLSLIISLLLLLAICLLVFVFRSRRYLVTGWLWYLIMLLPVIGLVQVGLQAHADRYTYLPQIGLYLALTWGTYELAASFPHSTLFLTALGVPILCALTFVARAQAAVWRDSQSLWKHAIACTPENATARGHLAFALYERGQITEALPHLRRSLELNPSQPKVHLQLAAALLDLGRAGEAISHFQLALQIDPNYVEAYSNLGLAFLSLGRLQEALSYFEQALRLQPDFAPAHYNLGNTYLEMGKADAAVASYERSVAIDPRDPQALNNAAWILATWPKEENRDGAKAVTYATRADHLAHSQVPVIHATLAAAMAETGRFEEAVATAERAASLARAQGNAALANSIGQQLATYRAGQAFRDDRHQGGPRSY